MRNDLFQIIQSFYFSQIFKAQFGTTNDNRSYELFPDSFTQLVATPNQTVQIASANESNDRSFD